MPERSGARHTLICRTLGKAGYAMRAKRLLAALVSRLLGLTRTAANRRVNAFDVDNEG
ncbi:hypothetical protein [Sphingomonas sp.]|uniref:hypothetical protein n=1 Tax=Sphingomonas sp. TaxID=28214 RepID=UPI002ED7FC33